ncbi:MAG: hypothetical protein ACRD2I_25850, partial [Vicinamibacterales bacterium]
VRLQPDGTTDRGSVRLQPDRGTDIRADPGLQPWQFFVLAALGCATAVTFMARGQGPTAVILLGVLMGTAALVGYAALRTLRPLVTADEDRTVMVGQRTRVALEREKLLTLRAIKELEFDRAMGRLSDQDWNEMSGRLRVRAARLMRQLDAGGGYRDQIEKELAKRIESDARLKPSRSEEGDTAERDRDRATKSLAENRRASALAEHDNAKASAARRPRECASCETANDSDAKFCKGCGQPLAGG